MHLGKFLLSGREDRMSCQYCRSQILFVFSQMKPTLNLWLEAFDYQWTYRARAIPDHKPKADLHERKCLARLGLKWYEWLKLVLMSCWQTFYLSCQLEFLHILKTANAYLQDTKAPQEKLVWPVDYICTFDLFAPEQVFGNVYQFNPSSDYLSRRSGYKWKLDSARISRLQR